MRRATCASNGCNPSIQSGEPLSGMIAHARSVVVATFFVTPIAIAVAIAIGAWLANRLNHARVAAVLGLAAYTTIHQFSVVSRDAGWLPFLCLVLGALIWVAPSWARWERQKPSPATPAVRSAPPAS